MTYLEIRDRSLSGEFRVSLATALCRHAWLIWRGDSPTTPGYEARRRFAREVCTMPEAMADRFALLISSHAECEKCPMTPTDAAMDVAVAELWSMMAGAF